MGTRGAVPLMLALLGAVLAVGAAALEQLHTVKGRLLFPVGMLQPAPSTIQVRHICSMTQPASIRPTGHIVPPPPPGPRHTAPAQPHLETQLPWSSYSYEIQISRCIKWQ